MTIGYYLGLFSHPITLTDRLIVKFSLTSGLEDDLLLISRETIMGVSRASQFLTLRYYPLPHLGQ